MRTGSANAVLIGVAALLAVIGAVAGWIASHPVEARSWMDRERPRLARLRSGYLMRIGRILGYTRAPGAYAISLILAAAALTAGGVAVGRLIIGVGPVPEIDARTLAEVVARRQESWTGFARALTDLGDVPAFVVVALLGAIVFALKERRWMPVWLMASVAFGAVGLRLLISHLVGRARPPMSMWVADASGASFPSGHTTRTVIYAAFAYLLARSLRGWRAKVLVWSSAVVVMLLVGATRVYLGVHWPTDVLGGWALALGWLGAVIATFLTISRLLATPAPAAPPREGPGKITAPSVEAPPAHRTGLHGLSEAEVGERIARGDVNVDPSAPSRSLAQIIRANVVTRFNALLGTLAVVILITGSPRDALFGLVIIANTGIGIVQEWRAKRVLDRLQLLVEPRATVLRAGSAHEIPVEQLVVDDLLALKPGDQIPVDGVVVGTDDLEVDESLLTGESEPVLKHTGDTVLSGSFVIAGHARAQATDVGARAYANRLAAEGRRFAPTRSELRTGIDRILLFVTWALVPTAIVLITSQFIAHESTTDAIHGAIAGVVGMVPEGLVLLTSLAMALAAIRLGRRMVLVQELSAVEGLARIDVLCVDKTGTITDGSIVFEQLLEATDLGATPTDPSGGDVHAALGALAAADPNPNASLAAIAAAFAPPSEWHAVRTAAFSSARRWSGVSFDGRGTWILGAPETVFEQLSSTDRFRTEAQRLAASGRRVLALGRAGALLEDGAKRPPAHLTPAALVVLAERVRPDAADTMAYFAEQGVAVKVLSGDNPRTVAAAAVDAGVPGADGEPLDASTLPSDPDEIAALIDQASVLGRVAPEQKRQIVGALQRRGHVVAMTGDGVNDVLALKDADLGIAMGSGTAASRAVAQVVLLENDFAAMPGVVAEGRRLIANIERTSGLFVTKTVYVLLLALAIGAARAPFPFLPRHLTLAASLTVGIPAFLLALAPNTTRSRPGFIGRVLRVAIPAGASIAAATLAAYATARVTEPEHINAARTAAVIALTAGGWSLLTLLTAGRRREQLVVTAGIPMALTAVMALGFSRSFFALVIPVWTVLLAVGGIAVAAHLLLSIGSRALLRAQDASSATPSLADPNSASEPDAQDR